MNRSDLSKRILLKLIDRYQKYAVEKGLNPTDPYVISTIHKKVFSSYGYVMANRIATERDESIEYVLNKIEDMFKEHLIQVFEAKKR